MIRSSEVTQGESDVVRPKEVLESFPNEGKHESVPRVKHTETKHHGSFQGSVERRCPVSSGDVGLQGSGAAGLKAVQVLSLGRFPQGGHNSWHSFAFLRQLDQPGCTDCN